MFYIYILLCADNTLYTGYTNNVQKRIKDHHTPKGSKYVRSRLPAKLVYTEKFKTKSEAMKREYEIKKMTRSKKLGLIGKDN